MRNEIKTLLIKVFGAIAITVVIFFFATYILNYNNTDFSMNTIKSNEGNVFKESWSLTVSFLSAIATIGASIIAAKLFNDWKAEQKYHNATKASEFFNVASDDYLNSYNSYVELIWVLRFNSNRIIETNERFEKLKRNEKNLKIAINACEISFPLAAEIKFCELDKVIKQINEAIDEILPIELNVNNCASIDLDYINENKRLNKLRADYDLIYLNHIRFKINEYLLNEALK
ncbi:hypothetical protein ACNPQK_18685 [Acinetobacter guillouiae]|uniref:hypothetical protein n=1 Tax=Acinetobacter guillouiae TaxID=106649 RepID=UPI003AF7AA3D